MSAGISTTTGASPDPVPLDWAGGILEIDLSAVVGNWRALRDRAARAECAAVVKADAYGLGVDAVAPALRAAGCRTFFVAHLVEGITLRRVLGADPRILVLNGLAPGTADEFLAHALWPVLNSVEQVRAWRARALLSGRALPAALQIDTGMSRFGLPPDDVHALADDPDGLAGISLRLVMSHLGCADEPTHPANAGQLAAFQTLRAALPAARTSLAASSGIFLGPAFHLDLVRPGAALYGVPPTGGQPNPMRGVVRLLGRVAQLRTVPAGHWVGYGARFTTTRQSRIATIAVGYADGFLRAGGNGDTATAWLPNHGMLPVVGRISMDCLAVDVTDAPDALLHEGTTLELIGPHRPLEDAASAAGTIGYEMLTALGRRFHRRYLPA